MYEPVFVLKVYETIAILLEFSSIHSFFYQFGYLLVQAWLLLKLFNTYLMYVLEKQTGT